MRKPRDTRVLHLTPRKSAPLKESAINTMFGDIPPERTQLLMFSLPLQSASRKLPNSQSFRMILLRAGHKGGNLSGAAQISRKFSPGVRYCAHLNSMAKYTHLISMVNLRPLAQVIVWPPLPILH